MKLSSLRLTSDGAFLITIVAVVCLAAAGLAVILSLSTHSDESCFKNVDRFVAICVESDHYTRDECIQLAQGQCR